MHLRLSSCSFCWLLSAVGVRMARISFMYADIYLYTVAVGVDCGAFSRSCGVLCVGWWCVYGCIKVCSVSCGGVYVYMYICMRITCLWWVCSCCVLVYDISIGLACDMVCYLLADGMLSARYIWAYSKTK